jgi:hypothetical protein
MNAKSTFCKRNFYASVFESSHLRRGLSILSLLSLLLFSAGMAQGVTEIEANAAGLNVVAPAIVLSPGEAATLSVEIGTVSSPVVNAVGFSLFFELHDGVQNPVFADLDFSNSWLVDQSTAEVSMEFNATTRILHVQVAGLPPVTGNGTLFEISLTSLENNLAASAMTTDGGGFVTVEDIGFKVAPGSDLSESGGPLLYPNPCLGTLYFDWQGNPPTELLFVDARGQIVASMSKTKLAHNSLDISGLSSGLYHAVVRYSDQSIHRKTIILQ